MDNVNQEEPKAPQGSAARTGDASSGDGRVSAGRALASAAVRNRLLEHYRLQTLEGTRTVTEIEMKGFDEEEAALSPQGRSRAASVGLFRPAHAE